MLQFSTPTISLFNLTLKYACYTLYLDNSVDNNDVLMINLMIGCIIKRH